MSNDIISIKRALISVFNKKGIVQFARKLEEKRIQIISTGGTASLLKKSGIGVVDVTKVTQFPEMMDGRIKTLHPRIHGGILAVRNKQSHVKEAYRHKIPFIDLVVVNLYPFEKTIEKLDVTYMEALEQIDIGGPAMLRSAGKNHPFVTVITDPKDYKLIVDELDRFRGITFKTRKALALRAFERTCRFDRAISDFLRGKGQGHTLLDLHYEKISQLRYGENPHQKAIFFRNPENKDANVTNAKMLQGKQLSFNNIVDADAAIELVKEFSRPTAAFIKHTNPCGVASSNTIERAFELSYKVDPLSSYGSVIALNRKCTERVVRYIVRNKLFVEILAAPRFDKAALSLLARKKNVRVLEIGTLRRDIKRRDIKKVAGGILVQTADTYVVSEKDLKIVSRMKPTKKQIRAMLFARKVVKHVKSNAVVFANVFGNDEVTTGIGAGQMSRVDAVFIARHKGGKRIKGSVLASDAFFPFPDGVEEAYEAGALGIIQPGGSIRDAEVIKKVDALNLTMVFTGIRSFRH